MMDRTSPNTAPVICFPAVPATKIFVAACVVLIAWGAVIRILWNDWRIDPQYSYGILVPLLVLGLLVKRWEDRPATAPVGRWDGCFAMICILASAVVLALGIPMADANPDWRPLGIAVAVAAVVLSLSLIFMIGGRVWLMHFAFPILFFLIAVPWTRNVEQSVMDMLMSWNASVTTELLHWAGFEAMRQGNLIVLPGGILGVEEACSGIRSLQSGMMVALFFGEVFRLHWAPRVFLLLLAVCAAMAGNIIRSFLLAWIASTRGISAVGSWHDSAGLFVLLVTVGVVLGFALRWKNKSGEAVSSKYQSTVAPLTTNYLSLPLLLSVISLLILSLVGSEWWFRLHERGEVANLNWELNQRRVEHGVSVIPIPSETLRLLFHPTGFSERWKNLTGEEGQVFYLRWPPGRTAVQAVSMHHPEVCLASIGMHLQKPLKPFVYENNGTRIPLRAWLFESHGRPVFVFNAILQEAVEAGTEAEDQEDSLKGRLGNFMQGRRNHGQRMLEVALWNLPDETAAREALVHYLNEAISFPPSSVPLNP